MAGRAMFLLSYATALACLIAAFSPSSSAAGSTLAAPSIPVYPYAYAYVSSTYSYEIMLADGVNKDRSLARVQVDSVFFTDVDARLSTDGTHVAFRVTGDHLGGSSLYDVSTQTGKYTEIDASRTASQGIGSYAWSPAGNTLAYVLASPALDPAAMDDAYGSVYIYSSGFQAVRLANSGDSDRVLGFSSDGLGAYVERQQVRSGQTMDDLVYLPISGSPAIVLLRSRPGLLYSHYTIWTQPAGFPKVAYLAEGDFSLAASNSNVSEIMPLMALWAQVSNKVPVSDKLSRSSGLGLMVSDVLGIKQTLLRRDAEAYGLISWTLDGSALLVGGARSGGSWRVDADGSRTDLGVSLTNLNVQSYTQDGTGVVLADDPATRLVTLDGATGKVEATKYVGYAPRAAVAKVKLAVPYIQQVNDTADNVDGDWACGPTSVAMALAYFGKLEPWAGSHAVNTVVALGLPPAIPASPTATAVPTGKDYAPYVTNEYSNNGHTYSAEAADPHGTLLAGLYGTICPTGEASWPMMASVLQWHGLGSQYVSDTWDGIVVALRRGHPVLLGNMLTSAGHIVLVVGYTADGNLIVNDPYGNKFAPGYGSNNGNGVVYPWKRVTPRHALEVIGTYPPPAPTATSTPPPAPTATSTPEPAPAPAPAP
jgi:hypothetical protein